MSDIPLPIGNAYVQAQLTALQLQEKTGLSLRELAEMDLSDYARLAYGRTPVEAGIAAYHREQDARYESEHPAPQQQAPAPAQSALQPPAPEYQGIDFKSLSVDEYAALRGQLGMGQSREYQRGIFDSAGMAEWSAAAHAKAGRTALSNLNVQNAPQIERAFIQHTQVEGRRPGYRGQ